MLETDCITCNAIRFFVKKKICIFLRWINCYNCKTNKWMTAEDRKEYVRHKMKKRNARINQNKHIIT